MGEDEVERVLGLLDVAGAREASAAAVERWAASALEAIAPLRLEAGRRADIEALADFFVRRTA
jgi:geranylgeranyl pyrophosphate synthase